MIKIPYAYCYETAAVEAADFGVNKRQVHDIYHHYFCTSENCGYPVDPAHRREEDGSYWYRSKKFTNSENHVSDCPHMENTTQGTDKRQSSSASIDSSRKIIVPTVLGIPTANVTKTWPINPPNRQEIAALAFKAEKLRVVGTIESVVTARGLIKNSRHTYELEIDDKISNYANAFRWIWKLPRPWQKNDWQGNIVISYCEIIAGHRNGVWFLNAIGGENAPPKPEWPGLILRDADFSELPEKEYVRPLLELAAAKKEKLALYWRGTAPGHTGKSLAFTRNNRQMGESFALRLIS
jgi:hypothetical protein